MDIEFHYYLTHVIAKKAGFTKKEADTIAYASQYVDDNDITFRINKGQKGDYRNFISQTMNILKPKHELMRIYPIFHFVPGDPGADTACRRDGKQHILNTTPGNEHAGYLLDFAFSSPEEIRLHHIGIATHAYADTWAHQNFIGWHDEFNGMGKILPNIGHADAQHHPDYPAHWWKDRRLIPGLSHINNINRFMDAGKELFNTYKSYLDREGRAHGGMDWSALEPELLQAIGRIKPNGEGRKSRIQKYKKLAETPDYDPFRWFNKAVRIEVRGLPDSKSGFFKEHLTFFRDRYEWKNKRAYQDTDWYRFQQAVKRHEREGIKTLNSVFTRMGIDLAAT
jgi:hypothetical protein